MPYAIRLPLVLKTVVVHLLLPAALAISLGAAGGVWSQVRILSSRRIDLQEVRVKSNLFLFIPG